MSKKRKIDFENRQFQEKWTTEYYIIQNNGTPMCLLCNESLSINKEYNMKRHFTSRHSDHQSFSEQQRKQKIKTLMENLGSQQQMFNKMKIQSDSIIKASFLVSEKIATHSKTFNEGEFLKECLLDVASLICPEKKKDFESICLSRRTVVRRIEMMADDVEKSLKENITRFEAFSIALDESTDASDTAQLAIFIRGVDSDFTITEELLDLQHLKGTTTGEIIFEAVNTVFERFGLKWSSLTGICTDGAPSMVGARKGFIGIVQEKATQLQICSADLTKFHCIIHQQNLCAKSIKFMNVMEVVINSVNFLKSRALNHRQFKQYLADIFSDYEDVDYYCEVRWLSKGKMLKRFYNLRNEISNFFELKGKSIAQLKDDKWVCDLAFLIDVTGYLNEMNLKLQTQGQMVHELYGHVKAFCTKLRLLENQMKAKNLYHFPVLSKHKNIPYNCYGDELKALIKQFDTRFADFQGKDFSFSIFSQPIDVDINQVPETLQMEFIDLQTDLVLKSAFNHNSLINFYKFHLAEEKFPNLRAFSRKMISLFGSTYLCEQFFSRMKFNKSTIRTRLTDENLKNSLRLAVSSTKVNIDSLVAQVQGQISH
jgi:hypothetical protein